MFWSHSSSSIFIAKQPHPNSFSIILVFFRNLFPNTLNHIYSISNSFRIDQLLFDLIFSFSFSIFFHIDDFFVILAVASSKYSKFVNLAFMKLSFLKCSSHDVFDCNIIYVKILDFLLLMPSLKYILITVNNQLYLLRSH